jgi:hypothetical protein
MTAAQLVVAALALWGAWDIGRRLIEWGEDAEDDSTARWQRRRRALSDVTRGRHTEEEIR